MSEIDSVRPFTAGLNPNGSRSHSLPAEFYDRFLSAAAKRRKPSPSLSFPPSHAHDWLNRSSISLVHSLYHLEREPNTISLLAGKPNGTAFPFTSLSFTSRSPHTQEIVSHQLGRDDLSEALQYGETTGWAKLLEWVRGLQERMHGRYRAEGWKVSIGSGSQDLLYKAFLALVDPGDSVLVECPVYAGVLPVLHSLLVEPIEVKTDSHGLCTTSLRVLLEQWPSTKPKPRVLYTVPYGSNPTGASTTLERRKETLALAREHDFLIMEDDPYFYLYYGDAPKAPSYFALEREQPERGRVIRFDSLSKILSAGVRIGFATGPAPILEALDRHTSASNLQTATFTQVLVFTLLDSWGYDGFLKHTENVSQLYRQRRDVFELAMLKHLSGLAEWSPPHAGMFYWFKLLLGGEEEDSEAIIRTQAFQRGVIALPGSIFLPNGGKTAYVRAAFSTVSEEQVDIALARLRSVVLDRRSESSKSKSA